MNGFWFWLFFNSNYNSRKIYFTYLFKKFGDVSWEVDALQPAQLVGIIEEEVDKLVDDDIFNSVVEQEREDIEKLEQIIKSGVTLNFNDEDEWGDWECPNCGEINNDPENIRRTMCGECESGVYLSDVFCMSSMAGV